MWKRGAVKWLTEEMGDYDRECKSMTQAVLPRINSGLERLGMKAHLLIYEYRPGGRCHCSAYLTLAEDDWSYSDAIVARHTRNRRLTIDQAKPIALDLLRKTLELYARDVLRAAHGKRVDRQPG